MEKFKDYSKRTIISIEFSFLISFAMSHIFYILPLQVRVDFDFCKVKPKYCHFVWIDMKFAYFSQRLFRN